MPASLLPLLILVAAVAPSSTASLHATLSLQSGHVAHKRVGLKTARVVARVKLAARADADGDGLSNGTERNQVGTNPRRFDSDGDGFGDGTEVSAGSNPRRAASVPPPAVPQDPTPAEPSLPESAPPSEPPPPPPPSDTTAPQTTISFGPSSTTIATGASFGFRSSESGSSFQCSLDSGEWSDCSSPKSYSGLALGSHTFAVKARDAAGNMDATPATRGWTVQAPQSSDDTPPETTIDSGPSEITTFTSASFTFSASEDASAFQCSLDSGEWSDCSSPKSFSGLAVGSHTFAVKATDTAGNTDATPATHAWEVELAQDTTPPNTSISSGPMGTTTSTSASFSFSASESGSSFQCSLDSGEWSSCSSPVSYGSLTVGLHTFAVKAMDGEGNTDASPATRSWNVIEPEAPASCTTTLSPGANVADAIARAAGGSTICLRSGSYGRITVNGARKSPPVTVRSSPDGRASVGGITLTDPVGLRFVALNITSGTTITPSGSDLQFVDNDITGVAGIYFFGDYRIGKHIENVLIEGNLIHDIDYTGTQQTGYGYGIEGVGDTRHVIVRDNTIKSPASDYIQSASPTDWVVDRNTFLGPSLLGTHADHQDLWQIFGGGEEIVFTNNVARNTQTHESLLFQEGAFRDVRIENNLFDHDSRGYTCQLYQSSGLVFRNNTVVGSHWGCLFRDLASSSPGSGYEVDHNVFAGTEANADVSTEGRAGSWGTYDYNVSSDGSAGGTHSVRNWSPSWSDTTSYGPVGLPFAAGYRP